MVNPAVMMLVVLGLFVWMLFHPRSTAPVKVFLFMAALMLFEPLSTAVMNAEAAAFHWRLDYSLYLIDRSLGVSAFSIARQLSPWQREIALVIYQTLGYWMMAWYALSLTIGKGRSKALLISYAVSYGLAPLFYLVAPACGPVHAFGAAFPMGNPQVAPVAIQLAGWPNAIPSLHFATAILFVEFAGKNRILQCAAWAYLAGTAAATLAFEHYFIDLVVAIPYAYFAIRAAEGRFASAFRNLGVTLAWLVSIRLATPLIVAHPLALRLLVLATAGAGILSLSWFERPARLAEDVCPGPGRGLRALNS